MGSNKVKKYSSPPTIAEYILKWLYSDDSTYSLISDIEYEYRIIYEEKSRLTAYCWYYYQLIVAFLSIALVTFRRYKAMFKNYLRVTYRNLIKHKIYSMINIMGLSLGIACCILIFAYISYEHSYDNFHKNKSNIYRLTSIQIMNGQSTESLSIPTPIASFLVADYPEVLNALRIGQTVKRSFKYKDKVFFQTGVFYVENSTFDIFSYDFIYGDPSTALITPFTMVITEETSKKYFGDQDPVGEMVEWDNRFEYKVTGVIKDPPENSHFTFSVLASFETYRAYDERIVTSWNTSFLTYLLLDENTDLQSFRAKLGEIDEKYIKPALGSSGMDIDFELQPVKSIHLHSNLQGELGQNSDIRQINLFGVLAIVILVIACFNFMNLATARSAGRTKEVGLRKVFGASRGELVVQFLGESTAFAFISTIFALIFVWFTFPFYHNLTGKEITLGFIGQPIGSLVLCGILMFVGLFAGSYPAFYLSSFKPISTLKGESHINTGSTSLRSVLVVSQFAVTVFLIIGTIIIFEQNNLMRNKELGFDKENKLVIAVQNDIVRTKLDLFKDEILKLNGVKNVCSSSLVPGELYLRSENVFPEESTPDQTFPMINYYIDQDFFSTFGIDIVKGRGFSKDIITDIENSVMINESAVKLLGWEEPIGKKLNLIPAFNEPQTGPIPKTVIGVFSDIHIRSLYSPIQPAYVNYVRTEGVIQNRARRFTLHLNKDDLAGTMLSIENKWKKTFPNVPYFFFFLDESIDALYIAEKKLGNIFRVFTFLAIIVGCLGLFGLASFTTEQRTKEIGIRKVIGSSVSSIIILLCRKYVYLITAANIIAWPIAYLAVDKWLQNFPYVVDLSVYTFVGTSILVIIIALFSVIFQSYRAARANPVDTLRHE